MISYKYSNILCQYEHWNGYLQSQINCCIYNCSFVSEHIETLEEIDMEYRELQMNWKQLEMR